MKHRICGMCIVVLAGLISCIFVLGCSAQDMQQGRDLFAAGNYDAAIKVFSDLVAAQSEFSVEVQYLIAECYVQQARNAGTGTVLQTKYADAVAVLRAGIAMANQPEDVGFLKKMKGRLCDCCSGLTYISASYFEDAISAYRDLAQYPDLLVSSQCMLGQLYMRQANYPEAIAEFKKGIAAAKLPDNSDELKKMKGWLADCYNGLTYSNLCYSDYKYFDQAISAYRELAQVCPDRAVSSQYMIGHFYARQGLHAEAATALEHGVSIATAPEDAQEAKRMKKLLLSCYLGMKDYTKLLAAARAYGAEHPDDRVYDVVLGICSQASGDYEKALQTYDAVLKSQPESDALAYALIWKAACLREQHEYEKQIAFLDQAIQDYPVQRPTLLLMKAEELYIQWHKHDAAVKVFDQVIQEFPREQVAREAQGIKGLALIDQGKLGEARSWYNSLHTSSPEDDEWGYYLAYCDYCEHNYATAQDALESICQRNPGAHWLPKAKYILADCCFNLGNYGQAAGIWTGSRQRLLWQ